MNYTYILECKDGTYYTGWTNNLEKRMKEHNEGKGAKYTRPRLPVELVYFETFDTKEECEVWAKAVRADFLKTKKKAPPKTQRGVKSLLNNHNDNKKRSSSFIRTIPSALEFHQINLLKVRGLYRR